MQRDYAPGGAHDPGASPLLADLAGLPPLLIMASGSEMLLDDSVQLAVEAGRAGVETVLEIWPGMPHCWPVYAGLLPEGVEAVARVAAFIDRVAAGRVVDGTALA
jgi:acetyl esterase/lipase